MFGASPSVVTYTPTAEELAAKEQAKAEKLNAMQEQSRFQTDRLFRLFGKPSSGLAGLGGAPLLAGLDSPVMGGPGAGLPRSLA